jgi:hypothetical protein
MSGYGCGCGMGYGVFYGWGLWWGGNPSVFGCCCGGAGVVTDNTVTWHSQGPIPGLYDINAASAAGWQRKATRAVNLVQTSGAGFSSQMQLVWSHCMAMAVSFKPQRVA